jgi:hypothetical protein
MTTVYNWSEVTLGEEGVAVDVFRVMLIQQCDEILVNIAKGSSPAHVELVKSLMVKEDSRV